jgi:hypothetical protein
MSYEKLTDGFESKADRENHEKRWGNFNAAPPGFTEITAEEFAQSGFFMWCKVAQEYRQIVPENIDQTKLLSPITHVFSITLFYMNHGDHFGIANDYWGKKVRYFKFAECFHDWQETSAPAGQAWNCYHYCKCSKCGDSWEYDSSD